MLHAAEVEGQKSGEHEQIKEPRFRHVVTSSRDFRSTQRLETDILESLRRRAVEVCCKPVVAAFRREIATGDLPSGDPARELADAAHDLDLLVTGSRGYGPVRRLMLGSTSTKLVHEAPCPVLVLTRGAEHEAEPAEAVAPASEREHA